MSGPVFVVSEWLAKEGKDAELWERFQELKRSVLENEQGCVRAHVTRQISHPGSPGKSKYTIVLLQEYNDIKAFDAHCAADHVTTFFKEYIDNETSSLVKDWKCRLFSENTNS